jgi:hypothetical protein
MNTDDVIAKKKNTRDVIDSLNNDATKNPRICELEVMTTKK